MSEPKAQLVDPQGNMNLPGMNATGVITATSFDGAGGVVTGLTGSPNLNVGVVTATSFVGDGTGHAAGLTGTPNLNLGVTTSTGFIGDAVGKAAGLTGTPNLNVGLITATGFTGDVKGAVTGNITGNVTGNIVGDVTGNITGFASSITSGNSLGVGVCTAIQYHGDGSALTGAGSSAYIAQEVTASGDETIIDLSYGNLIYYKGEVDTTVGFASTSAAEQLTFIRDTSSTFDVAYNESFSTGGVTFDGTGDYLSIPDNAAFQLGSGDWTMECFWKSGSGNTGNYQQLFGTQAVFAANDGIWRVGTRTNSNQIYFSRADGSGFEEPVWNINVNDEAWHHLAFTRADGYVYCWVDGVQQTNVGESNNIWDTMTTSNAFWVGYNGRDGSYNTGTVSSLRIVKGTAVYTTGTDFLPPSAALTNVTNTVLLCCQSDSSTTASTVSAGTITANGDPAAGAQTVAYSGTNTVPNSTSITWPDRVKWNNEITPTLFNNPRTTAMQVFHFTTVDTGLTYNAWEEMKTDNASFDLFNWGANNVGQLGDNTVVGRSSPIQVSSTIPWWSKIANYGNGTQPTGDPYGMAIKSDASLWSWGQNKRGGGGWNSGTDTASFSSPVQILGEWSAIARCYNSSLGVKPDGTLWAWGTNDQGGNGTNNRTSYSSPTQVGTDTTWETGTFSVARAEGASSGTDSTSAAISTDTGKLFMWGDNSFSTLGHDDTTDRSSPTQVPGVYIPGGSVHMERRSVRSLSASGQLKAWGQNDSGQLGQNNTITKSDPSNVPGTWAEIDCGSSMTIGVKTDGTLWTWGDNWYGSLGLNQGADNHNNSRSSPTQVGTDTNWNKCGMGYGNGMASKTDGTLWIWGLYNSGFLGQNTPGGSGLSSPTQIPGTDWVGQLGVDGSRASILRGRNYPS